MSKTYTAYSMEDMCAMTGLCSKTVARLVQAKQLPGYKQGKRYIFPDLQVDAWRRGEWTPEPIREQKRIGVTHLDSFRKATG